MNKFLTLWLSKVVLVWAIVSLSSMALASEGYGASGADNETDKALTLDVMLNYALEDEYLARGEYQKIMDTFGAQKPYSNIIKAEAKHITWLLPLFEKYGFAIPADRGVENATIPASYAETFAIGVDAEIANINMYDRFLNQDLPSDVEAVFVRLRDASKNHLAAFQKWQNKY
ncbi:ferritin-like domain-containing protein [Marinomonas sp. IMCC 4694]|uniref:ferritin-like domain-containing protein n=1 Tax=Marinomonas sp. IMCC 4694 TaxID=2605432 RepID=UPI0011E680CB|nr:DUF2202 domain-containing protein [Marinomonas sp. IMCC 4694]TYL49066.1 DUF2202 domain-containing protein [Marinomonas sp. IMCC 4694]